MALDFTKCRMNKTQEFPVVAGYTVMEEGFPLVREFVDGKENVRVYDGTGTNLKFIGFSYSESLTPTTATESVEVTLDASGKATLNHEVISGQITVYVSGTRVVNASVTVAGKEVTVTGNANKAAVIVYMYEPTMMDLMQNSRLRLLIPTMSSSQMTGSIGAIMDGIVYTDKIDLSADFTAVGIKFGITDDGLLTCYTGDVAPADVLAIDGNIELVEYPGLDNVTVGVRING